MLLLKEAPLKVNYSLFSKVDYLVMHIFRCFVQQQQPCLLFKIQHITLSTSLNFFIFYYIYSCDFTKEMFEKQTM